ncbi:LysR family transcriptional regulator [Sphingomonas sp. RHCKR7]|uniref:LysR family transcriptional regulator n=1 Tax=Sphingomonas folli TaxID=2862497 RepID=UPI001C67E831|nr:LysR family transcriptional regulator [Sphingomonas folli]MBW6527736.1 LysR family transcriptional regulator [Sphingomonas folli]
MVAIAVRLCRTSLHIDIAAHSQGTSPIKPVDANLLTTLAILLQTRSISRAAKRMGVSQPTVSRSLGQLRAALADPLLVRSGGRMALTQRGAELAQPLEAWLATTSTLLQPATFSPATLDRRFTVAASDYGVLSVLSPMLPSIQAVAPACRIDVTPYSEDMFQKLAAGEIDIIVHGFNPDQAVAHARPLFQETQSVILRRDHPLLSSGATALSFHDYLAWPHIAISIGAAGYDHVDTCLAELSARRQVLVRVPYFYAAPDLIGGSDAILTMPSRAANRFANLHNLACLSAPDEIAGFGYWALVHERSVRDAATQWLTDMLASGQPDLVAQAKRFATPQLGLAS